MLIKCINVTYVDSHNTNISNEQFLIKHKIRYNTKKLRKKTSPPPLKSRNKTSPPPLKSRKKTSPPPLKSRKKTSPPPLSSATPSQLPRLRQLASLAVWSRHAASSRSTPWKPLHTEMSSPTALPRWGGSVFRRTIPLRTPCRPSLLHYSSRWPSRSWQMSLGLSRL